MKRHLLPLLTLFMCASSSLITHAQQLAVDFLDSGINKNESNDFTGALQAFNMAITMNPKTQRVTIIEV